MNRSNGRSEGSKGQCIARSLALMKKEGIFRQLKYCVEQTGIICPSSSMALSKASCLSSSFTFISLDKLGK